MVNFWESYLANVVSRRVRDVHLELHEDGYHLRERISSGLTLVESGELLAGRQLLASIGYKAGLDLGDEIQEGRLLTDSAEFRISMIPTEGGCSCVMRVLPPGDDLRNLSPEPEFSAEKRSAIEAGLTGNQGWILLCGPTGSGKTTTLYYLLSRLNDGFCKIITVEDPVERAIPGIVQTEVQAQQGWGMTEALRRILRHDPDVIMLGEIRDSSTAEIASRAALTGHKVLSTIHSADAVGVVDRLRDLGVSNGLQAEIMEMSIAQRLLPRNCIHCRRASDTAIAATSAGMQTNAGMVGEGCNNCAFRGLAGTVMLAEVLTWSSELREMIRSGAQRTALMALLHKQKFSGLEQQIGTRIDTGDISPVVGLSCLQSLPGYKYSRRREWS